MRQTWRVVGCIFGVGAALAPAADQEADVKAQVARAVRALGGAETLNTLKGATWKGKGTVYGLGKSITYTGEWAVQPPERLRIITRTELDGRSVPRILVVDGSRGWLKIDGRTEEMDAATLAEEKERLYANWVASVAPLIDQPFDLAPLVELTVDRRPAVGIRVSRSGHRDVHLYFDKKSWLLLKSEIHLGDLASDKVTTEEVLYTDYRERNGLRFAGSISIKRGNVLFAKGEISEFQPRRALPVAWFARP